MGNANRDTATGPILGIDLGAATSVVSVYGDDGPEIVPSAEGDRSTPTVVSIPGDGDRLVGKRANDRASTMPARTVASVVAHVGADRPEPTIEGEEYPAERLLAPLLSKLKRDAESALETDVDRAVVTVPARLGVDGRRLVRRAGRHAGLTVERTITAPTAAALASWPPEERGTVVVCDVGAETTDVSVLEIGGGVFEVVSTVGVDVGSNRWDETLAERLLERFEADHDVSVTDDPQAHQRVRAAVETARRTLDTTDRAAVSVPYLVTDDGPPHDLETSVDRETVAAVRDDALDEIAAAILEAINRGAYDRSEIDEVRLVGGVARSSAIGAELERRLDIELTRATDATDAPALGAAIYGGIRSDDVDDVVVLDTASREVGIELEGGHVETLVRRDETIPTEGSVYVGRPTDEPTIARLVEGASDAEPPIVLGAATVPPPDGIGADDEPDGAVHASPITVSIDDPASIALDVDGQSVPLEEPSTRAGDRPGALPRAPTRTTANLGLELADGGIETVVEAGTSLPATEAVSIAAVDPGQDSLTIRVVATDDGSAERATLLGDETVRVAGLEETVSVRFDVGRDGELEVAAAGASGSATITVDGVDVESSPTHHRASLPLRSKWPPSRLESDPVADSGVGPSAGDAATAESASVSASEGTDSRSATPDDPERGPTPESESGESRAETPEPAAADGASGERDDLVEFAEGIVSLRDDLERAVGAESSDVAALREGVSLVLKRFDATFERAGFDPVAPEAGAAVDPVRHRVVDRVDSALPEGTIVDVESVGYELDGRLVRPATVSTSSGAHPLASALEGIGDLRPPDDRAHVGLEAFDAELEGDGTPVRVYLVPEAADEGTVDAFRDRVDAVEDLGGHETIPDVLRRGESPRPWVALERPAGVPLFEWAADASLAARLRVLAQICDALGYAHRNDRRHHALAAEAVLVSSDRDAFASFADWGLEHPFRDRSAEQERSPPLAPEQVDPDEYGEPGPRTDVYLAGALAVRSLAVARPDSDAEPGADRPSPDGAALESASEPGSAFPPGLESELPSALEEPVRRATSERPADRYESATAFADALRVARSAVRRR